MTSNLTLNYRLTRPDRDDMDVIFFFGADSLLSGAPASALTRLDTHHPQKHHLLLRPHVELQYVQQHQRGRPPCQHIGLV